MGSRILCCDRWRAYEKHRIASRQLCWAPSQAELREISGPGRVSGRVREGGLGCDAACVRRLASLQARRHASGVRRGDRRAECWRFRTCCTQASEAATRGSVARLLEQYAGLWTFAAIDERYAAQVAAHNLGVLMRKLFGIGKPRRLQGAGSGVMGLLRSIWAMLRLYWCSRRQVCPL